MPSEYQQLVKREFKPYSRGHQLMYDGPIKLLEGKQWEILEIGFGIGFGAQRMIQDGIVSRYVGCEPDKDSFAFAETQLKNYSLFADKIEIHNCTFNQLNIEPGVKFDYTFCIEVIEHLTEEDLWFLCKKLDYHTRDTIFLSTPDPSKSKEGKWSMYYLENLFRKEFFRGVSVIRAQWTNLWILNP